MAGPVEEIEDLIHEPTQLTEHDGVSLTVTEIYEIDDPGRVDFGGGELEHAKLQPHDRVWRTEDDDYQWWHLDAGTYLLEYNETLDADEPLFLQPRVAIVERGAFHPTLRVDSLPRVPLTVGGSGIRLKENARVSTVLTP